MECQDNRAAKQVLDDLVEAKNPIGEVFFVSTRQSMRNGGGPACLRLRVVLSEIELAAVHSGVMLTEEIHDRLVSWVTLHYRDRLAAAELHDPKLLAESRAALDDLTQILGLGSLYSFQRA